MTRFVDCIRLLPWVAFFSSCVRVVFMQQVLSDLQVPRNVQKLFKQSCASVDKTLFPRIKVRHNDETHNTSFNLTESTDVFSEHTGYVFNIKCYANYPIKWVVNYFFNGYPTGKSFSLHLQLYRKANNFWDSSTYQFYITKRMRYKNNHGFKNFSFTCQSVQRPDCLKTGLYTTPIYENGNKSGITVNIREGVSWGDKSHQENRPSSVATSHSSSSMCDYKVFAKNVGFNSYQLSCEFDDNTHGTVKAIHQCANAISCMTFQQIHLGALLDERCVKFLHGNNSCANCHERTVQLSQGFLACVSNSNDEAHSHKPDDKVLFFFSSLPQKRDGNYSKLYFSMEKVDPLDMISLGKVSRKVSVGEQVTIVCNTSSYYFAFGTKIAVKHRGSNHLSFLKTVSVAHVLSTPENVYEANIPITTNTIERVYCFAPTWNSFAWVNKSEAIRVSGSLVGIAEGRTSSPRIVVAVGVTLLVTSLCCCLLFGLCWVKLLRKKLSKFGKLLTPQEIEEFRRIPVMVDAGTAQTQLVNGNDYINTSVVNVSNEIMFTEISREQLLLDETVVLGKGYFGKVLKGIYVNSKTGEKADVAVKTLKTKTDASALKSLLSELKIMAMVGKNLNVVNLVGACTKKMEKGEVYMAVEFCANGNLMDYLRSHRDNFKNQLQRDILIIETPYRSYRRSCSGDTIFTLDLIKWSWEIARGMEFLSSKKVIHGDLAARNILLTSDNVAKVSDFGLSRQLVDYYYVKEESGPSILPWKWMSLETLRDMKFSIQSDIWSCGVTLWELFTLAEVPYCGCSWSAEFVQALDSGHRLGKPQYATSEMYDLMRECWNEEPGERPSFYTIKMFFEDIITQCTYQDYMQLDLYGNISSSKSSTCRTPLLTLTPTVEALSDCEGEDDVFEQ